MKCPNSIEGSSLECGEELVLVRGLFSSTWPHMQNELDEIYRCPRCNQVVKP